MTTVAPDQQNFGYGYESQDQTNISSTNEVGAREFLQANRWPVGLQDTFIRSLSSIAIRYFICDDSGSMMSNDGHKFVVATSGERKLVSCSRWSELVESLKFYSGLSKAGSIPSEFRLLNLGSEITIGVPGDTENYNTFLTLLNGTPSGGTPLCFHIRKVIENIQSMQLQLRAMNQKACVIIATDGESSDGDIAQAMRPLKDLPVTVIVRLCTDEERIVNYWSNIDHELELNMDVLDDLCGEADAVFKKNGWLTYGEPLQRLREFGVTIKEVDLLDEKLLPLDQILYVCSLM
jgi:hypothetical protein